MANFFQMPGSVPGFNNLGGQYATNNGSTGEKAAEKKYRSDVGMGMTDAEYAAHQTQAQQQPQSGGQSYGSPSSGGSGASSQASMFAQPAQAAPPPVQAQVTQAGGYNITQGAYEGERMAALQKQAESDLLNQRAKLSGDAFKDRLGAITGLIGNQKDNQVQYDPQGDETAARASAFARAKEQAGQTAGAAVNSLQDLYAGQGLSGSTMEAAQVGGQVGGAATNVNDFTREQYIQDLNRARDIANTKYAGGIQQRGQNMNLSQSLIGLANAGMLY